MIPDVFQLVKIPDLQETSAEERTYIISLLNPCNTPSPLDLVYLISVSDIGCLMSIPFDSSTRTNIVIV